jgi:hypothetical protein
MKKVTNYVAILALTSCVVLNQYEGLVTDYGRNGMASKLLQVRKDLCTYELYQIIMFGRQKNVVWCCKSFSS